MNLRLSAINDINGQRTLTLDFGDSSHKASEQRRQLSQRHNINIDQSLAFSSGVGQSYFNSLEAAYRTSLLMHAGPGLINNGNLVTNSPRYTDISNEISFTKTTVRFSDESSFNDFTSNVEYAFSNHGNPNTGPIKMVVAGNNGVFHEVPHDSIFINYRT